MDPSGGPSARFRLRRGASTSSDEILGIFTRSRPGTADSGGVGDELSEDDVLWTGDFSEHDHSSSVPSTTSSSPNHHHRHIGELESFGILAALPETDSDQIRSVFNHKASAPSSSSASSSRMIPMILKKPPLDRQGHHQSAPVNVPVMTEAMRRSLAMRQINVVYDKDDEGDDGEMLPPHEVVASRHSPMVSCSVLEGVGRTLKGRDLRQVRNAVFRKTGFID